MYPQVFGKYVLERELSRGGMARVLLATLRGAGGFEKKLVVKQIRDELAYDSQFVRRFVEEAKTTVALSHPNIVPVYELGVEQGTYFLAMELVEGLSIAELLRERTADGSRRVLTPEEGAYVGIEVCRALDYAHRRMKVVHRDITPRNVMIDEEGQVKLIDFGIAAPARVAGHEILGSPGHMPPEQVDGAELGPPTDIFAVAVLLMEAWTGTAPFRRATPEECNEAMRQPHPKPSDFDARLLPLDEAISRAMRVDPRERQQRASDLGRALRSFLRGIDVADVARALGDRVRDVREGVASPGPPSQVGEDAPRAAMASQGDLGTQTFAARDEALKWSSPPPADVPPDAPSTRRLSEGDGAAPIPKVRRTPSGRPRGRPDDPVMSIPTPLMVEPVGDIEAAVLAEAKAKVAAVSAVASEPFPADRVETIATRPLETPVRPPGAGAPRDAPKRPSPKLFYVAALAVVAGVGGLVAWRSTAETATDRPALPPVTSTVTPSATATVTAEARDPEPSAPTVASRTAPPSTSTAPPPTTSTGTPSAPTAVAAGRASVLFLGDPGTKVSIDGASRGPCPIRVSLEPGQHEARFIFEPTGESRGERFSVKPGDQVTVRADFTGATPTVRINR